MTHAKELADQGQLDKALREYLKIAASDETDVLVFVRIGDLYVKLNQKAEAIANYRRVASHYLEQGQTDKAIAVYQQILQIDSKSADAYLALGGLYRDVGKIPLAMQQFELAAQLFLRAGKTAQSLLAEQAVVDLAPESLPRRIRLAELYSKENLPNEAAREFERAAQLLRKLGRLDEWVKVLDRLLFVAPQNVAASNDLARHFLSQGEALKALARLQSGFKQDRQDRAQLELLAQAFLILHKPDKAVAVLKELARQTADRQGAESVYRRVLDIEPSDPDAKAALSGGSLPSASSAKTKFTSALILNSPSPGPVPASKTSPVPPSTVSGSRLPAVSASTKVRTTSDKTPVVAVRVDGTLPPVSRAPSEPLSDEEEQERVLAEAESYLRFGLRGKALESLRTALSLRPSLKKTREKLASVLELLGQHKPAIAELRTLADQSTSHDEQARYLRDILRLDNRDPVAFERLRRISGEIVPIAPPPEEDEPVIEMSAEDDGPTSPSAAPPKVSPSSPSVPQQVSGPVSKPSSAQSVPSARSGTLREELAEVDFFRERGMFDDARRLLRSLSARYPHSQTVSSKLAELSASGSSSDELIEIDADEIASDSSPKLAPVRKGVLPPPERKTPASASARSIPVPPPSSVSGQSLDKSGPVYEARDPAEAYQRGIAHRNRGQHALAISEFKIAMQDRKLAGRAVLLLGQCYRDLWQLREAIEAFKEGLYMPQVVPQDLAEMNYQLAQCYERLQNPSEAVYFYQQTLKTQPGYKDAAARLTALRK
ncbi:MAG TPA: tetratricopeptide repeat protein [Pseudomonadota bacterium]|nr:tetratricopeptide repeat protein [Pseudomonadota bacterium]